MYFTTFKAVHTLEEREMKHGLVTDREYAPQKVCDLKP